MPTTQRRPSQSGGALISEKTCGRGLEASPLSLHTATTYIGCALIRLGRRNAQTHRVRGHPTTPHLEDTKDWRGNSTAASLTPSVQGQALFKANHPVHIPRKVEKGPNPIPWGLRSSPREEELIGTWSELPRNQCKLRGVRPRTLPFQDVVGAHFPTTADSQEIPPPPRTCPQQLHAQCSHRLGARSARARSA